MSKKKLYGKRWLMFAPGHDNLDHRVDRTVNAIVEAGNDLTVFFEDQRLIETDCRSSFVYPAQIVKTTGISFGYFKMVFNEIRRTKPETQALTIYVHDSGFIGLIICIIASVLKRPGDRLIMDYHDSLEWELHFQSAKFINIERIRIILVALVRYLFKTVLQFIIRIDLIVGISELQIVQLRERFGVRADNNLPIPNTRIKLSENYVRRGPSAILWVGNVSNGRRFEQCYELRDKLKRDQNAPFEKILFIGKCLNDKSKDLILQDSVLELGGFKSDSDIATLTLQWKAIGVFFGWDDAHGSGLNEISSVNKVYSYINTNTPFLIPNNQLNMIRKLQIPSEFIFDDLEEMAQRFKWISENYRTASNLVTSLKDAAVWDADVFVMLKSEFIR